MVWALLLDLEQVAPCLPGASAEKIDATHYRTRMNVRLGPVNMTYQGELTIVEVDETAKRAVLAAKATELRGQGNANARAQVRFSPAPGGTQVEIVTDLQLAGRVAQMGRGIVDDVSRHLLDTFIKRFSERFATSEAPEVPHIETGPAPAPAALSGIELAVSVVKARLQRLWSAVRAALRRLSL